MGGGPDFLNESSSHACRAKPHGFTAFVALSQMAAQDKHGLMLFESPGSLLCPVWQFPWHGAKGKVVSHFLARFGSRDLSSIVYDTSGLVSD